MASEGPNTPRRRPESFDTVAGDYNVYRTPYPEMVVETLAALANLDRGVRVLEIGCGSGQLSVALARRGVDLLAVEPGPHLAAFARQNLSPFPNARVEVSAFEAWPAPAGPFDAVVCASAFHWLDPDTRFTRCAAALRPGGRLAILHVHHVRGGEPGFFEATQPIYQKWGLGGDPFFQPPAPDSVPTIYPELEGAPAFRAIERRQIEAPMRYSTAAYTGWLRTDSLINSLDTAARSGFLQDIARLIDTQYGGDVSRNFVYDIVAAQRV